jgi:hypothetical protein
LLLEDGQRRRMSLDPAYPWLLSGMTPEKMKHVPIVNIWKAEEFNPFLPITVEQITYFSQAIGI